MRNSDHINVIDSMLIDDAVGESPQQGEAMQIVALRKNLRIALHHADNTFDLGLEAQRCLCQIPLAADRCKQ